MKPPSDAAARALLGGLITLGFFGTVFVVLFVPVPTTVRDIVLVLLGALIASFKEVTGYFFGSSSGSTSKDETIARAIQDVPSGRPGDPVSVDVENGVDIDPTKR